MTTTAFLLLIYCYCFFRALIGYISWSKGAADALGITTLYLFLKILELLKC